MELERNNFDDCVEIIADYADCFEYDYGKDGEEAYRLFITECKHVHYNEHIKKSMKLEFMKGWINLQLQTLDNSECTMKQAYVYILKLICGYMNGDIPTIEESINAWEEDGGWHY